MFDRDENNLVYNRGDFNKKILKYLELWDEESSRDPPVMPDIPSEIVYVPVDDSWSQPGSDLVS